MIAATTSPVLPPLAGAPAPPGGATPTVDFAALVALRAAPTTTPTATPSPAPVEAAPFADDILIALPAAPAPGPVEAAPFGDDILIALPAPVAAAPPPFEADPDIATGDTQDMDEPETTDSNTAPDPVQATLAAAPTPAPIPVIVPTPIAIDAPTPPPAKLAAQSKVPPMAPQPRAAAAPVRSIPIAEVTPPPPKPVAAADAKAAPPVEDRAAADSKALAAVAALTAKGDAPPSAAHTPAPGVEGARVESRAPASLPQPMLTASEPVPAPQPAPALAAAILAAAPAPSQDESSVEPPVAQPAVTPNAAAAAPAGSPAAAARALITTAPMPPRKAARAAVEPLPRPRTADSAEPGASPSAQAPTVAFAPPVPTDAASSAIQLPPADGAAFHLDAARQSAWLDGLARDIAAAADPAAGMRFAVAPEKLGEIRIDLSRTDAGASIRLTAAEPHAHALLADAQPRLHAEARASGVRIADSSVDLAGRHSGGDADGNAQQRAAAPPIRTAGAAPTDIGPARLARAAAQDRYA